MQNLMILYSEDCLNKGFVHYFFMLKNDLSFFFSFNQVLYSISSMHVQYIVWLLATILQSVIEQYNLKMNYDHCRVNVGTECWFSFIFSCRFYSLSSTLKERQFSKLLQWKQIGKDKCVVLCNKHFDQSLVRMWFMYH